MQGTSQKFMGILDRAVIGALVFLVLLVIGVQIAKGAEVIPSVGLTRPVDGNQTSVFGSLGFRGELAPVVLTEIGIAYRTDSRFDDRLRVRMWPITASLWLAPVPALYAGGGVGWYQTTFDYDQDRIPFPVKDETKQEFGIHLGDGLRVPLSPAAALDLHGRYVMMRDQESHLIPQKFDPDFWLTSLGLGIHF